MDRDFDGRLTLEEFLGEETPIEKLFKLMDKNGDGFVTKKECVYTIHFRFYLNEMFTFRSFRLYVKS